MLGEAEEEKLSLFPDATTLAPGHFIPLPEWFKLLAKESNLILLKPLRTNLGLTGNRGTEEQVKRQHGGYTQISKLQNVGNLTGQLTSFFNK